MNILSFCIGWAIGTVLGTGMVVMTVRWWGRRSLRKRMKSPTIIYRASSYKQLLDGQGEISYNFDEHRN